MADFCMRCCIDLYFGPRSDLDGLSTAEDTANGLYPVVLCEGCGPIQVDHLGRCIGGCDEGHVPPGDDEVLRRHEAWAARRSGPLGVAYRLRDWFLGTPWDPGEIHCPSTWWTELLWRLWKGRTVAHETAESGEWGRIAAASIGEIDLDNLDPALFEGEVKFLYPVLTPLRGPAPHRPNGIELPWPSSDPFPNVDAVFRV